MINAGTRCWSKKKTEYLSFCTPYSILMLSTTILSSTIWTPSLCSNPIGPFWWVVNAISILDQLWRCIVSSRRLCRWVYRYSQDAVPNKPGLQSVVVSIVHMFYIRRVYYSTSSSSYGLLAWEQSNHFQCSVSHKNITLVALIVSKFHTISTPCLTDTFQYSLSSLWLVLVRQHCILGNR